MVHINAAAISDDGEASAGIGIQPGIEGGNAAVFIAQQHCIGQVHASLLIKAAGHMDLGGIFPEKIGCEAHIDTLGQLRMAVRISFFQQDMVGLCSGKHFLYLLFVHGEGLFTENVFSRFGHLDGPLHVQPVGQRNVYGIHIFVIQQGLIIRIELLRGKRLRVGLQLFFIPTCNRIEFRIRCRQHGRVRFLPIPEHPRTPQRTRFFSIIRTSHEQKVVYFDPSPGI